jgi:hypothetical protein
MILKRLYELVWRPTAGRPWTYEIRDWCDRHVNWALTIAIPVTASFVVGQMVLVQWAGWFALPFMLFADFMAFVAGHLFWDTAGKYIQPKAHF